MNNNLRTLLIKRHGDQSFLHYVGSDQKSHDEMTPGPTTLGFEIVLLLNSTKRLNRTKMS